MKLKRFKQELENAPDDLDVVILRKGKFYMVEDVDYNGIQLEITPAEEETIFNDED